ncbi:Zinc finger CCCH domain-containing protein [Heracleum sosnowskyi]|uniref:Zinc finger CCCH domain-containing protein n=1 Tax=Heracleum sosnowskyi TaxID=360622 RepID=A0AAD8I307_9APIA|nr:Zinc finger CCCH domain-containing protein [Heracleum sosnowskyi]
MENLELETLKLYDNACSRRRPLKSRAFDTFLRIVSECHLHFQNQEQVATVQGDRLVENNDLSMQGDRLVESNDDVGTEDGLACGKALVHEDREGDQIVRSQESGFLGDRMDVDGLEFVDRVKGNDDQGNGDNIKGIESVMEGKQNSNNDFAAFASLLDSDDQLSLPDFDMEGSGLGEQLGDKTPCADVSELIDSLLDTDVTVGASIPIITVGASIPIITEDGNSSHVKRNEIETPTDARESDIPVSASPMVSSSLQKTVEGIEDGEISEVSTVLEKSSDLIHEDAMPLEKNSVDKGELSGDIIHKEGSSPNALRRGPVKEYQYFGLGKNGVKIGSTALNVEKGNDNQNLVDNRNQVYYGDTVEDDREKRKDSRLEFGRNRQRCAPKEKNSQASCPKKISLSGGSTGENTVENQCSASTEKVADQNSKKRKRGCSEEGKANRKKRERMKRADKNRELGVKKLKLRPVSKPKTVIYCRHFLNGRCHEGEKCKFSHDTVPLTKSKPCCYFARQSCMKGDDCPFDHQLSKYPCNSFLSQGSCVRGSNCMFSHEVPVKEGSLTASDTVKENSLLKNQTNSNSTGNQNSSSGVSYCKNDKKNGEWTTLKRAGQAPKGLSFLSHGNVPVGNMSKHVPGDLSPEADNGTKVDQQTITSASNGVENLNKNTLRSPAVPRGVNFLSFGKAPSESLSTKKSSFSLVSNGEIGKSPLSDPRKGDRAGSSSITNVGVKVDSQTGHGASIIVQNMIETENRTPAMTPRGQGFLSVGNLLDNSSNKKQAGSNLNERNGVLSTDKNNDSVSNTLQTPNPALPPVSSSPFSHDHSLGKLIDLQSKSSLSSFQGSLFSNTPSSVQRAFQSTLALAAKFESKAKNGHSSDSPAVRTDLSKEGSSSQNKFVSSTILDFLYSVNSKTKQ